MKNNHQIFENIKLIIDDSKIESSDYKFCKQPNIKNYDNRENKH